MDTGNFSNETPLSYDEYRDVLISKSPSFVYEWQVDLAYKLYLAYLKNEELEIEKAFISLSLNNKYYSLGRFN